MNEQKNISGVIQLNLSYLSSIQVAPTNDKTAIHHVINRVEAETYLTCEQPQQKKNVLEEQLKRKNESQSRKP